MKTLFLLFSSSWSVLNSWTACNFFEEFFKKFIQIFRLIKCKVNKIYGLMISYNIKPKNHCILPL